MARKESYEFSEDDDLAIASGGANFNDAELSESGATGIHGMGEDLLAESMDLETERANQARQTRTATQARGTTGRQDTPTSMNDKRGNQPR